MKAFVLKLMPGALLLLLLCGTASANLLRVNNNLTTDKTKNIYASFTDAQTNAVGDGTDTLLVDGSTKEYTGFDCTKKLVIIGPGYFLTQNGGQANSLGATVQAINFRAGSEGSIIMGLQFSSGSSNYQPQIYASNIAIMRCLLTNGLTIDNNITSLVIIQNYIGNNIILASSSYTFSGVILKNNIMNELNVSSSASYPRIFTTVEHNIIANYNVFAATTVQSNIFLYAYSGNSDIASNIIQNNAFASSNYAALPTNVAYNSSNTFVGTGVTNSPDGQYKLVTGSPMATAGYNGEAMGVFGGSEPYVISGIPPIPTIYQLESDALANKQDGLNVTIKAKANQ